MSELLVLLALVGAVWFGRFMYRRAKAKGSHGWKEVVGAIGWGFLFYLIASVVVGFIAIAPEPVVVEEKRSEVEVTPEQREAVVEAGLKAEAEAIRAKAKAKAKAEAAAEAKRAAEAERGKQWSYYKFNDGMSANSTYQAVVNSSNTVNFDFPYNGAQRGKLTLRTHPRWGKDLIITIEKGQIICPSYDGCNVLVRFDDEKASNYSAAGAADNSSETLFIQNYSRFVGKMLKAKRVRISFNVYQEGYPVFDFDVSDFSVDKYKGR